MPLKHNLYVMMALALLAAAGWGGQAYADIVGGAVAGGVACPGDGGVALRIVLCVKMATIRAADTFLISMYEYLGTYIAGFTTLAVVIYGVMLAAGAFREPAPQTFILLFKIAFIGYFAANFGLFYHSFLDMMDELIAVVTSSVTTSNTLSCAVSSSATASTKVWGMFDCAILKLVGAGKQAVTNKGLGLAALVLTIIFSAKQGFYMFLMILGIIITFIIAVARSLYIFINAYVAVALLSAFAPLMLPFAFFQHTREKFVRWVNMIIGFMLQPIFLVAFLVMALNAVDVVLFKGEDSVFRTIAGDEALAPDFNLDKYLNDNGYYREDAFLNFLVLTDPWKLEGEKPEVENTGWWGQAAGYVKEKIKEGAVKLASLVISVKVENIDIKKIAAARGVSPPIELVNKIMITLAVGMMMGFVFISLLDYIPQLASELGGGMYTTPSLLSFGKMPGEAAYQATASSVMGAVQNMGKKK